MNTIRNAKNDLKQELKVKNFQEGSNADRKWFVRLLNTDEFEELPEDVETPFEDPPPSDI